MTLKSFDHAANDIEIAADGLKTNAGAYLLLGQAFSQLKRAEAANNAFCKAKALGDARAEPLCKAP